MRGEEEDCCGCTYVPRTTYIQGSWAIRRGGRGISHASSSVKRGRRRMRRKEGSGAVDDSPLSEEEWFFFLVAVLPSSPFLEAGSRGSRLLLSPSSSSDNTPEKEAEIFFPQPTDNKKLVFAPLPTSSSFLFFYSVPHFRFDSAFTLSRAALYFFLLRLTCVSFFYVSQRL